MKWTDQLIDRVAAATPGGYLPSGPPATEPIAWAAMSLAAAGRAGAARRAADWLANAQQRDGAVGVTADQSTPAWPTSLSILAWLAAQQADGAHSYQDNIQRAVDWALEAKGRTAPRKPQIGHDTMLVGWSWAADTHSWLEPTAMFVKALRQAGYADHPRVREGVRLLTDRLLPSGGANYGNTMVLGQELLAHAQPTGIVLWALAGEAIEDARLPRTIDYLSNSLTAQTTTASLAFAVLGLTVQNARPAEADSWLEAAFARQSADRPSLYKLALLAAALPSPAPTPLASASS